MITVLKHLFLSLVFLGLVGSLASAQTVITIEMEVSGVVPFIDIDVTVTVDANGTITVDNTGPNVIDPVNIPDWAVPDGMTPRTIDLGTVTKADAAKKVGIAIAGALMRAYGELIGDQIADFLEWFHNLWQNAQEWVSEAVFSSNATSDPTVMATQVVASSGLDPEFGSDIIAAIASKFQDWLDDQS